MKTGLERFSQLLQRMEQSKVALPAQRVGCTEAEIAALETRYGLRLPQTYTLYLRTMGHQSGRLFAHDHMAVFYPYVLHMTADLRKEWAQEASGPPPGFALPEDALLIAGRLGQQFEFIRSGQEDSPLWYFNTWEWEIRESHPSVLSWLEVWCEEAERAIASGYFDGLTEGTIP